jgi:hypothetical protein
MMLELLFTGREEKLEARESFPFLSLCWETSLFLLVDGEELERDLRGSWSFNVIFFVGYADAFFRKLPQSMIPMTFWVAPSFYLKEEKKRDKNSENVFQTTSKLSVKLSQSQLYPSRIACIFLLLAGCLEWWLFFPKWVPPLSDVISFSPRNLSDVNSLLRILSPWLRASYNDIGNFF